MGYGPLLRRGHILATLCGHGPLSTPTRRRDQLEVGEPAERKEVEKNVNSNFVGGATWQRRRSHASRSVFSGPQQIMVQTE
jgi:hypothetical protein